MRRKVLLPLAVLVVAAGVAVWWQQGGTGGPVGDGAARRYFARIVDAAMAKDFDALCRLNSSVGTCEFELNYICRNPATGGPLQQSKEELERNCPCQFLPNRRTSWLPGTSRAGVTPSAGGSS
jgi:hypothetical protein